MSADSRLFINLSADVPLSFEGLRDNDTNDVYLRALSPISVNISEVDKVKYVNMTIIVEITNSIVVGVSCL